MQEYVDCQIIVVPGKFDFKHFAMGYQKNSPYAEIFDYYIEKMRQSGVLDSIHNKNRGLPQKCPDFR